jgi:uncharacterized DUF497 family protein
VQFSWDPEKSAWTRGERGFGFDYTVRIFAGPTIEAIDGRRDYGEERIRAIGEIDGRTYVVIYTYRSGVRWIISAWKASGKDRRAWQSKR